MAQPSITSPRFPRVLLLANLRPNRAVVKQDSQASPLLVALPHAKPLSPLCPLSVPRTGNELRKVRAFETKRILAAVARQRRVFQEATSSSKRADRQGLLGEVNALGSRRIRPSSPSPGPSIIKFRGRPSKGPARHVSFGETTVRVVDRWIKPRSWPRLLAPSPAPAPPSPAALSPPPSPPSQHALPDELPPSPPASQPVTEAETAPSCQAPVEHVRRPTVGGAIGGVAFTFVFSWLLKTLI